MDIILEQQTYFLIKDIIGIKTYLSDVNEYQVEAESLIGELSISLTYYDTSLAEKFENFTVDFDFVLDKDIIVDNVKIDAVSLDLFEGAGINCNYALKVSISAKPQEEVLIQEKNQESLECEEPEIIMEPQEPENNIQVIEDNYKALLDDSMNKREDPSVSIISTKSSKDEEGFLNLFFNEKKSYYNIISLIAGSPSDLDAIAAKYDIPLSELLKGYDADNKRVVFKLK